MRNILEIYEKYKLPKNLQLHQLRVASVAKILAENYEKNKGEKLPVDTIVKACLLHDMGNIVKFKMEQFPEFIKPDQIEYWKGVQNDFIKKYGKNENQATLMIVRELRVLTPLIKEIIKHIDFTDSEVEKNISVAISHYADMRVGPHGVLSLKERLLSDWAFRTPDKKHIAELLFDRFSIFEKTFFEDIGQGPNFISDELIAPIIEELKKVEI